MFDENQIHGEGARKIAKKGFSTGNWSHDVISDGKSVGAMLTTNDGRLFVCLDKGVDPESNFEIVFRQPKH